MGFKIYATNENGESVFMFTWMRCKESGLLRAKHDAIDFADLMPGLHNFEAVPV